MGAEDQIRGYFAFDQADLNANRIGEYTARQKKKYLISDSPFSWFLLITSLVFLGFGGWRISVLLRVPDAWNAWVWPITLCVLGLWFFRSAFRKVDTSIERAEGEAVFYGVTTKTGSVTDSELDRYTMESTSMNVGGKVFDHVSPAVVKYLEGKRVIVYYTSSTKHVLSVDVVPTWE